MLFLHWARERIKRVPSKFWMQFLLACVIAFGLELGADWLVEGGSHESSPAAQSVFDVSRVYRGLLSIGPRQPISHFTTIVEIDPDPNQDPLSVGNTSLCRQREFIAKLLEVVASANPAAIVLDKYFDSSKCQGDQTEKDETQVLLSALESLSRQVPIVSGVDATPVEGPRPAPDPRFAIGSLFRLAIVNLDRDTRRLPLEWKLDKKDADILARTGGGRSLALQTAMQFDPHIQDKNARLKRMIDQGENPYISFLDEEKFATFYAGEILCLSDKIRSESTAQCGKVKPLYKGSPPATLRDLAHQIVIVGERAPREDIHASVIGEVPGFFLQANYIEALLDDRVFRVAHPLFNYALGFLIFAVFEYILLTNEKKPLRAIAWAALLLVMSLVILFLAAVHLGYYLNPATVSLLAIAINVGHLIIGYFEEKEDPRKKEV
jgi:CHASE2 domain-containing sensor protein